MLAILRSLEQKQVGFYIWHDSPGGQRTVYLNAEELAEYSENPVCFLAKYYGVSTDEYLEWHRAEYKVFCSEKTKKGTRCCNTALGFHLVDSPKEWVEAQGSYCATHS